MRNHEHPGAPHLRNYNGAMQLGRERAPSPTLTSGVSAPILPRGEVTKQQSGYAKLLDERLPQIAPTQRALRLASFFCCGGGIDLGFRSAGFRLSFANDISEVAAETFEQNLKHAPIVRDADLVLLDDAVAVLEELAAIVAAEREAR